MSCSNAPWCIVFIFFISGHQMDESFFLNAFTLSLRCPLSFCVYSCLCSRGHFSKNWRLSVVGIVVIWQKWYWSHSTHDTEGTNVVVYIRIRMWPRWVSDCRGGWRIRGKKRMSKEGTCICHSGANKNGMTKRGEKGKNRPRMLNKEIECGRQC